LGGADLSHDDWADCHFAYFLGGGNGRGWWLFEPASVSDLFFNLCVEGLFDLLALGEDVVELPSASWVLCAFVELHQGLCLSRSLADLIDGHALHEGDVRCTEFFVFGADGLQLIIDGHQEYIIGMQMLGLNVASRNIVEIRELMEDDWYGLII
jgi:hypothetical protein